MLLILFRTEKAQYELSLIFNSESYHLTIKDFEGTELLNNNFSNVESPLKQVSNKIGDVIDIPKMTFEMKPSYYYTEKKTLGLIAKFLDNKL